MIDLEKNKRKAEEELQRLQYGDDKEACTRNFLAFLEGKRAEPKYQALVNEYLSLYSQSEKDLWKEGRKTELGKSTEGQYLGLALSAGAKLSRIKKEILNIHLEEIMKEEVPFVNQKFPD